MAGINYGTLLSEVIAGDMFIVPFFFGRIPATFLPLDHLKPFFSPLFFAGDTRLQNFLFLILLHLFILFPPPLSLRTLATPLFAQQTAGSQARASQGNLERGLRFAVKSERWHRDLESRGLPLPNEDAATQAGKIPLIPDKQVSLAVSGRFFVCLAVKPCEGPGLNEGGCGGGGGGDRGLGGGLRVARRAKLSADKGDHAENDSKVRPILSPDTRREQVLSIPHPDVDLKDQTV